MTETIPYTRQDALTLTLSDGERDDLLSIAERLATTEPQLVDEPGWIRAALAACGSVPLSLRDAVRAFRHDPGINGTLVLRNLPIDETRLPATPTVAESVERTATVPASVAVLAALSLGELGAYRAEKGGALVQNVVPVPGHERSQSNAGSTALELHMENAFHPHLPDYVGLLCLRNDHLDRAALLTSSIRAAYPTLDPATQHALRQPAFTTDPPPSFGAGAATPPRPILTGSVDDPIMCVDFAATTALHQEGEEALLALRGALLAQATSQVLTAGDMAFVDNRIAIHGRSEFAPRYDGRDRWLHRTFVHLDARRTRGYRPGNGFVFE